MLEFRRMNPFNGSKTRPGSPLLLAVKVLSAGEVENA